MRTRRNDLVEQADTIAKERRELITTFDQEIEETKEYLKSLQTKRTLLAGGESNVVPIARARKRA